MGCIGVIIFVVEFEVVVLVGISVSCVIFYNVDWIVELDLYLGDIIVVCKVGEIIFEVVWVLLEFRFSDVILV